MSNVHFNEEDANFQDDCKGCCLNLLHGILNVLAHVCIGVACLHILWPSTNQDSKNYLTFHVALSTIGELCFFPESLLVFSPYNGWTNFMNGKAIKRTHYILGTVGFLFFMVGNIVEIIHEIRYKEVEFYGNPENSTVGEKELHHYNGGHVFSEVVSVSCLILSFIYGAIGGLRGPPYGPVKKIHIYLGLIGFLIALFSYSWSLYEQWFVYFRNEKFIVFLVVLIMLIGILSTYTTILTILEIF